MLRRIALVVAIAGAYTTAMYTSFGCGPVTSSPTAPEPPVIGGTLRGVVTDASNNAPIPGASVSALHISGSSGVSLFTDINGRYEISVASGTVNVTASREGYQTFTTQVQVASSAVTTLDIKLQRNP